MAQAPAAVAANAKADRDAIVQRGRQSISVFDRNLNNNHFFLHIQVEGGTDHEKGLVRRAWDAAARQEGFVPVKGSHMRSTAVSNAPMSGQQALQARTNIKRAAVDAIPHHPMDVHIILTALLNYAPQDGGGAAAGGPPAGDVAALEAGMAGMDVAGGGEGED